MLSSDMKHLYLICLNELLKLCMLIQELKKGRGNSALFDNKNQIIFVLVLVVNARPRAHFALETVTVYNS